MGLLRAKPKPEELEWSKLDEFSYGVDVNRMAIQRKCNELIKFLPDEAANTERKKLIDEWARHNMIIDELERFYVLRGRERPKKKFDSKDYHA